MNLRLVLSEANLFHLQTRRNAKPAESWKPCITALELIQTLYVAASFRRASQFCPVLLSIVHNPGLFNAPRRRYTWNVRVTSATNAFSLSVSLKGQLAVGSTTVHFSGSVTRYSYQQISKIIVIDAEGNLSR